MTLEQFVWAAGAVGGTITYFETRMRQMIANSEKVQEQRFKAIDDNITRLNDTVSNLDESVRTFSAVVSEWKGWLMAFKEKE